MSFFEKKPGNVLVTGGCGFIGSHLVKRFLELGHRVRILDDLSTGSTTNVPLDEANLSLIKGSVLNKDLVSSAAKNCDVVFHLASCVGMKLVSEKPNLSYEISKFGTENVLATAPKIPVVLFSSSAVYGLTDASSSHESREVTREHARNYDGGKLGYASGKWELENLGKQAMRKGRKVIIVRPYNVIGVGQSGNYGMVVPNFIKKSLSRLPLTIYDDGEQTRAFSCVQTFVDGLLKLAYQPNTWAPDRSTINIGTSDVSSINDLAQLILIKSNSRSLIHRVPYESAFPGKKDVRKRLPDTTRFTKLVGPMQWPSLEDIISLMINSYQQSNNLIA